MLQNNLTASFILGVAVLTSSFGIIITDRNDGQNYKHKAQFVIRDLVAVIVVSCYVKHFGLYVSIKGVMSLKLTLAQKSVSVHRYCVY